jgi:hypothetical protein
MKHFTTRFTAVLAALLLSFGVMTVVSASASTSPTYYACLNAGTLTKVGTTAPSCTAPAKRISWASESQLAHQTAVLATENGQKRIQTVVSALLKRAARLATASGLASVETGVATLSGQLQGSDASVTLTTLANLISATAAGGNLSALQSALTTAIANSVAPLATAANLATLQTGMNSLPSQLQGANPAVNLTTLSTLVSALAAGSNLAALQSALSSAITSSTAPLATASSVATLQTNMATLQASVNTLNSKLDTLCSAQGAAC